MSQESIAIWTQMSSDPELIAGVRAAEPAAFGYLYERHYLAARNVAAHYCSSASDIDDVVAESFSRVLHALQQGDGPDLAFRAYLFTVVRRTAIELAQRSKRTQPNDNMEVFDRQIGVAPASDGAALEGFEHGVISEAFRSLPERWQAVLWYTEIEGKSAQDIAPLMGLSANGVAALSYRAREALRQAYLQHHLAGAKDIDCVATNAQLGAYVRGGLGQRETAKVEAHLKQCDACAALVAELNDVNSGLKAVIAPLVLGALALKILGASMPIGGALGGIGSGAGAASAGPSDGGSSAANNIWASAGSGAAPGTAAPVTVTGLVGAAAASAAIIAANVAPGAPASAAAAGAANSGGATASAASSGAVAGGAAPGAAAGAGSAGAAAGSAGGVGGGLGAGAAGAGAGAGTGAVSGAVAAGVAAAGASAGAGLFAGAGAVVVPIIAVAGIAVTAVTGAGLGGVFDSPQAAPTGVAQAAPEQEGPQQDDAPVQPGLGSNEASPSVEPSEQAPQDPSAEATPPNAVLPVRNAVNPPAGSPGSPSVPAQDATLPSSPAEDPDPSPSPDPDEGEPIVTGATLVIGRAPLDFIEVLEASPSLNFALSNTGDLGANDVSFTIELPAGLTFSPTAELDLSDPAPHGSSAVRTSPSSSGWNCDLTADEGTLTCTGGSLDAGAQLSRAFDLDIVGSVDAQAITQFEVTWGDHTSSYQARTGVTLQDDGVDPIYADTGKLAAMHVGATLLGCEATAAGCFDIMSLIGPSNGSANNNAWLMTELNEAGGTSVSASTSLQLPPGAVVTYAMLEWAANRHSSDTFSGSLDTALFKTPGMSGFAPVVSDSVTMSNDPAGRIYYQSRLDVTDLVANAGSGEYSLADIAVSASRNDPDRTYFAGFALTVIYSDPSLGTSRVAIFDGSRWVGAGNSASVTFATDVPSTITAGWTAFESDRGLGGDQLLVDGQALTPIAWDGSLGSASNAADSTAFGGAWANSLGVDAKSFSPYVLDQGLHTVTATSSGDNYLLSTLTITISED